MTDWHIHIGEYRNNSIYRFDYVFKVLKDNGVDRCWYAYLTPKYKSFKDSFAFVDYSVHHNEKAVEFAKTIGIIVNPLCWIDPVLITDGIASVEWLFTKMDYKGIAIHPFHKWNDQLLDLVFQYASLSGIPVFVHTGISKNDSPLRFEKQIERFQHVMVHLAHCKDAKSVVYLFEKYPNVYGDTAFCSFENYEYICNAGFQNRMLFGTDFPITHWYSCNGEKKGYATLDELDISYKSTLKDMQWYKFDTSL